MAPNEEREKRKQRSDREPRGWWGSGERLFGWDEGISGRSREGSRATETTRKRQCPSIGQKGQTVSRERRSMSRVVVG